MPILDCQRLTPNPRQTHGLVISTFEKFFQKSLAIQFNPNHSQRMKLNTYYFTLGNDSLAFQAWSYDEALAQLVFSVGGEPNAAAWVFSGAE